MYVTESPMGLVKSFRNRCVSCEVELIAGKVLCGYCGNRAKREHAHLESTADMTTETVLDREDRWSIAVLPDGEFRVTFHQKNRWAILIGIYATHEAARAEVERRISERESGIGR